MSVPGSNLLAQALTVIAQQTVLYRQYLGRATSAQGKFVPSYAALVEMRGSFQPIKRSLYERQGLDLQKRYANFYAPAQLFDVERGVSGDQFLFDSRLWQCESLTPWFSIDGWVGVLAIDVGPAPNVGFGSFTQSPQGFEASGSPVSSGAGVFSQPAQEFMAAGSPVNTGTASFEQPPQDFSAVGESTPVAVVAGIGSGLNVPSISPQSFGMAGLGTGSFAYADPIIDQIVRYTVNTGTGVIASGGTGTKATQSINLANVATNTIGYYYYTGITGIVRQYAWVGSWDDSTATGQPTIAGSTLAECCKVAANVLTVSSNNGDRTYSWGSDVYTQITTTAPGSGGGPRPMAYLSENNVAVFSPAGGSGFNLRQWVWNGSVYSHSGNQLYVAIAGITSAVGLSSSRVVAYSKSTRAVYVYDRIGDDWVQTGTAQVGGQSATDGRICGLPGTNFFIHVDNQNKTFRLFSVT